MGKAWDVLAPRDLELGPLAGRERAGSPWRNWWLARDEDGVAWLALDLGRNRIGGQRGERRLFRQVRPRHHRPEPRFDIGLIVPFAPRPALGHALIF